MKNYKNHYLLALMLSCAVIAGCTGEKPDAEPVEPKPAQTVAPTVAISKVAMTDIAERLAISGTLIAKEEIYVNTRINGYAIEQLKVSAGDRVKKGDVLVVLDDSNLSMQVRQSQADLARTEAAIAQAQSQIRAAQATSEEARINLVRTDRLYRAGHISQQELDRAYATSNTSKANVTSAESGLKISRAQSKQAGFALRTAKDNKARTVIRSPVDGIISDCAARVGAIANAGAEPLCKIIKGGTVELEAEITETALAQVDEGHAVELTIPGSGKVRGSVRLISPTLDARTRLAKVKIKLPNSRKLRPGMSGSGWIIENSREAFTVPVSAIATEDGKTVVSVVNDGVVEKREIIAGSLSTDGQREVVSGLRLGETVITKAGVFYREGDRVKVVNLSQGSESNVQ